MQTITAIIPAKNEQENIARCLESVNWCDKVQVLWMGNDRTGEISRSMGAEVIELNKKNDDDFKAVQQNINWAIDQATTDWILRIDADEVVTPELKEEIQEILKKDAEPIAYGVPRKQFFNGSFLKGGDWAYDRLVRLFKPKYARYENLVQVHEQFKVNGKIDYLHQALLHYSHPTLADARRKFHIYTDLEKKQLNDSLISAVFKMVFLPPYIFLRWMIWHQGYKDGARGIIAGAYRGWYDYLLYSKYIKYKSHNKS